MLLEGQRESRWFDFFRMTGKSDYFDLGCISDEKGFLQFVDLPHGEYTLKVVRAGQEPVPVKAFTLESGYRKADIGAKLHLKESVKLEESLKPDVWRREEMQKPK